MKIKTNQYWFVPKKYGYGFSPISWEGWLFTLALVFALTLIVYLNHLYEPSTSFRSGLRFLFETILIVSIATIYSKPKTKGKLKWNWGKR